MGILAAAHPRNGGNIVACNIGNIFEHHGFEVGFVSFDEKFTLIIDNCRHSGNERLLALFDSIDKPACCIYFLLGKHHGIFHLARLIFFIGSKIAEHFIVGTAYAEFGNIAVVEQNGECAFIIFNNKIGYNCREGFFEHIATPGIARLGIEFYYLIESLFQFNFGDSHRTDDSIVMFFGEFFKKVCNDFLCIDYIGSLLSSFELQYQTLLEIDSTYTSRIKLLHFAYQPFHLLISSLHTGLKYDIVHHRFGGASQIPFFVNVADDVIHQASLTICQL